MTATAINPPQIPGSTRVARFTQSLKSFLLSPRWIFIIFALGLWQTYAVYRASRLIPTPVKVGATMWKILTSGIFFEQLAASMTRILIVEDILGIAMIALLSGIATGLSWLAYFKALQLAPASRVAPIDKLSLPLTVLLAWLALGEPISMRLGLGIGLMVIGAMVTVGA